MCVSPRLRAHFSCEGGGRGGAQVLHGDQVVELRVQLAVQEVEGKEEDREGQVEVEEEKRIKGSDDACDVSVPHRL